MITLVSKNSAIRGLGLIKSLSKEKSGQVCEGTDTHLDRLPRMTYLV